MKMIQKALAVLCALVLLTASAFAEGETAATPSDLGPAATEEQIPTEDSVSEGETIEGTPVGDTIPEEVSEEVSDAEAEEELPDEISEEVTAEQSEEEIPENNTFEEEPAAEHPVEEVSAEESGEEPTEEKTNEDEPAPGIEIVVAKTLQPGQSWSGTIKHKTPTILKLDMNRAQTFYILVKGEDVLAAVQKADRYDETASGMPTDAETNELVIGLNAEAGSYLISLKAGDNSLLAKVEVIIMDQAAYDAWIAENQAAEEDGQQEETAAEQESETETEPEEGTEEPETDPELPAEPETDAEETTEANPEGEPEEETETEIQEEPEDIPEPARIIEVYVTWDVPEPIIGDTAHFHAILTGYEGLDYTMQWQFSPDQKDWTDIEGETKEVMDVIVTEENNLLYWRIVIYLEQEQED